MEVERSEVLMALYPKHLNYHICDRLWSYEAIDCAIALPYTIAVYLEDKSERDV